MFRQNIINIPQSLQDYFINVIKTVSSNAALNKYLTQIDWTRRPGEFYIDQ